MDGVIVHAVGGKRRKLQKRRTWIDERHDTVARQKFAARNMPLARSRRTAERRFGPALMQLLNQRAHGGGIRAKLGAPWIDQ